MIYQFYEPWVTWTILNFNFIANAYIVGVDITILVYPVYVI